jgi:hypothetical protein
MLERLAADPDLWVPLRRLARAGNDRAALIRARRVARGLEARGLVRLRRDFDPYLLMQPGHEQVKSSGHWSGCFVALCDRLAPH